MATASPARRDATEAVLDAAEALLVEVGYAAITVRKLADRAGVNHGLVHYYFGSMEEVFLQTLERFTDRLIERQTRLYAAEVPFVDKWRTAMAYLSADFESGYQKVWLELQAMAWNHGEMRDRVAAVVGRWQDVLQPAFELGLEELGLDKGRFPPDVVVTLVRTFNEGLMLEHLSGVTTGHAELLAAIDQWLAEREDAAGTE
jgi:TetR/AcrR family transcriptional regulator